MGNGFELFDALIQLFWIVVFFASVYAIAEAVMTYGPDVRKLLREKDMLPCVKITWTTKGTRDE